MADRIELDGVSTWFDERGAGEPVVLLHGGFSDAAAFDAMAPELGERFRLFLPERRGHGRTPDVDGPITYDLMADDTIRFLERVVNRPAHLVGHSDGGIIALLVAMRRPDLARRIVPISANYHHTGIRGFDVSVEQLDDWLGDHYGALSPDGRDHFPVVAAKLLRMIHAEPTLTVEDLGRISVPTMVMAGDTDLVQPDHTVRLHEAIPGAQLAIVPGTSHALIAEKPRLVAQLIIEFLTDQPVDQVIPLGVIS